MLFLCGSNQARANRRYIRRVRITERGPGEFDEYPRDAALAAFHIDDRVYLAVAIASGIRPDIVNATDGDWDSVAPFIARRYSIRVRRICP